MPPQPATRASAPPSSGKKILGLPRSQFFIIAGLGAAAIIGVILIKRKQAAAASTATSTGTGGCPDGSTPDANGNCPDNTDLAGELATLQTELGDLQANQGAGASGGGTTGTIGGDTGTGASTTPAAATGTPGGTSTAAPASPGTTSGTYQFPAPKNLQATRVSSHGCTLSWNAVTGPGGQKPVSYSVRTTGGGTNYTHTAVGTSTGEYGPGGKNLKPSTSYTSEVWANGGPIAPPHATVTWQTLKAGG